ncbi:unnamed protein product, partial [Anisakis simplex]|uniref:HSac2 domain-containing protein n=1 Tax=Anisakis simplex TaxID=6269 RepID=A0A0M3K8F9_ANISI
MLSPSKVKREIFSSDDDGDSENEENKEDAQQNDVDEDDKIELLEFERNIMLDTLTDDVLFILASASEFRETLYMEGGVHFITSRILMIVVQLSRVIHFTIVSIKEIRWICESVHKYIFSDYPTALNSIGCLQRLVNRLYVRRVRLVPRFDVDVKRILDIYPGSGNDDDDDITNPSSALTVSMLEVQLKMEQFSATDKQQRLATDLKHLRSLLHYAEEHDPATLYHALVMLRTDKQEVMRNSGWLFTPTSSKLFLEAEKMCKVKKDNQFTLLGKTPILVLTESYEVSRQLRDLIKWGRKKFAWVQRCQIAEDLPSAKGAAKEPQSAPLWDPTQITLFVSTQEGGGRAEIVGDVQAVQKVAARQGR